MTVVMVTHDMREAFTLATRVVAFERPRDRPEEKLRYGATITKDISIWPPRQAGTASIFRPDRDGPVNPDGLHRDDRHIVDRRETCISDALPKKSPPTGRAMRNIRKTAQFRAQGASGQKRPAAPDLDEKTVVHQEVIPVAGIVHAGQGAGNAARSPHPRFLHGLADRLECCRSRRAAEPAGYGKNAVDHRPWQRPGHLFRHGQGDVLDHRRQQRCA